MNIPLVSISCITYNHASYIRECIDGLMMQQCDFQYEILIHDDCSTDGTDKIIREYQQKYPEIIKPIFQIENQWSKGVRGINFRFNFPRAKGKYIAMCEGDDYWSDPLKLKKQVDFLEENPSYWVVSGGYATFNKVNGATQNEVLCSVVPSDQEDEKGFYFTLLDSSKVWITKTLTCLFRNVPEILLESLINYKYVRDVHLFYELLKNGNGYYFKEILGVYTIHDGGIFSLKSKAEKYVLAYELYKELYEKSPDDFTRISYYKSVIQLLENKLYHTIKYKEVTNFHLIRTAITLAKKQSERIGILKCFIPLQVRDAIHRLRTKVQ